MLLNFPTFSKKYNVIIRDKITYLNLKLERGGE